MPIESTCTGCGKMLRVADEHAGKRARCPECGFVFTVTASSAPSHRQEQPLSGPQPSTHSTPAAPIPTPQTPAYTPVQPASQHAASPPEEMWYMKTPEGQVYGPIDRRQLDVWVSEGRVTHDCHLRQGEYGNWQLASTVFPVLAPVQPQHTAARPTAMAGGAYRPYQPAATGHYTTRSAHQRPHRGPVILVLAILGWFTCPILAIIAWVMAAEDLGQMRRGVMDRSGMGMTQAGMVIAIIVVALIALTIVFGCLISIASS